MQSRLVSFARSPSLESRIAGDSLPLGHLPLFHNPGSTPWWLQPTACNTDRESPAIPRFLWASPAHIDPCPHELACWRAVHTCWRANRGRQDEDETLRAASGGAGRCRTRPRGAPVWTGGHASKNHHRCDTHTVTQKPGMTGNCLRWSMSSKRMQHWAEGQRAGLECSKSNRGHEAFMVRMSNLWWRWSMSRSSACSAGEEGGQAASASSSSSLGAHSSQRS